MRNFLTLGAVLILVVLHSGTVRKEEDPIRQTQTDPILYKQKVEEEKDGVKGAPMPTYNYYGKDKDRFLIDPPIDQKKEEEKEIAPVVDDSEVELQAEDTESEESEESEDWWESDDEGEEADEDIES